MLPENVERHLSGYKRAKGRIKHLEAEVININRQIEECRSDQISIGAQRMTGMPHGSSISDPTALKAIQLIAGIPDEEIRRLTALKDQCLGEIKCAQLTVMYVDAWLEGLQERERWIIEQHVIEGITWREVCRRHSQRYQDNGGSRAGLRYIKRAAMDKIYEMAK